MTSENTGWEPFDPSSGSVPESLLSLRPLDEERGAVVVTAVAPAAEGGDWPALVALRVAELCGGVDDTAILIDLGLEAPTLHVALAEPPGEGITDVFLFSASLQRVSRTVRKGTVRLVQAGTVAGDPALVRSHRAWSKLLGREIARGTTVVLHVPLAAAGSRDIIALADTLVLMAAPGDSDTDFAEEFPGTVVRLAPPTEPATVGPPEAEAWDEDGGQVEVFAGFEDGETVADEEDSSQDEVLPQNDHRSETDGDAHEHPAWSVAPESEAADAGIIVIDTLAPELHATLEQVQKAPAAEAREDAQAAADPGEALDAEFAEQSSAVIDAVFTESVPEAAEEPPQVFEEQSDDLVESSQDWSGPPDSWPESSEEHEESAYPWEDRGDRRADADEVVEATEHASLDPFAAQADRGELDAEVDAAELEAEAFVEPEGPAFDMDAVPNPFARRSDQGETERDDWPDEALAAEFEGLPGARDIGRSRKSALRVAATIAVVVIGAGAIGLTTVRPTDDPEFDGGLRPGTMTPAATPEALAADPQLGDPWRALGGGDPEETAESGPADGDEAGVALAEAGPAGGETSSVVDQTSRVAAGSATPDEASDETSGRVPGGPTEAKAASDPPTAQPPAAPSERTAADQADAPTATDPSARRATRPSPDRTPAPGATAPDRAGPPPAEERSRTADPTPADRAEEPDPTDAPARDASARATERAPAETPTPTASPAAGDQAASRPAETPAEPAVETPARPADETPARPADETPERPADETPDQPADETPDQPAASPPTEEPPVVEAAPSGPDEATAAEPTPPAPTSTARDDLTPPPPSTRPSGLMAYGLEVGSHSRIASARAQSSSLQAKFPHLEFIEVPVRAEGGLVYRVVAGPAATASEAEGLRTSLTGFLGRAASSSATVRSTGLTFLLGAFEDYPEAKGRVATARERGIPAYLAEFPVSGGRMVYRVYAGAFASEAEAAALGSLLEEAGLGMTPLIERMGRPTR
jgi:hypothetical protein